MLKIAMLVLGVLSSYSGMGWAAVSPSIQDDLPPGLSQWTVARDGTGKFFSLQEAIDQSVPGQAIWIKAGKYEEDVTVHSKENLTIIGAGMDRVILAGLERVGTLHIGKWPYGAKHIVIRGLTVLSHSGLAVGIFNGSHILLKDIRVKGMVFGQQVQDVRVEHCIIGTSETTGVGLVDSQAILQHNFIHDNDHGVAVSGSSQVLLKQNVIVRSLFQAVRVSDSSNVALIRNTLVHNGGGIALTDTSQGKIEGNIVGEGKIGILFSPKSQTTIAYNTLYGNTINYQWSDAPQRAGQERGGQTDLHIVPLFVNSDNDDFRLQANTPLAKIGGFPFLGALPSIE